MVLQGFFSKKNSSILNHELHIEPFACLNGSLHGEMALQIDGECVVDGF